MLLLDEPSAGLDPVASSRLKDRILTERAKGATIILTSHVMSELEELTDEVLFLLEGKIRYRGGLHAIREMTGEKRLARAIARLMRGEVPVGEQAADDGAFVGHTNDVAAGTGTDTGAVTETNGQSAGQANPERQLENAGGTK